MGLQRHCSKEVREVIFPSTWAGSLHISLFTLTGESSNTFLVSLDILCFVCNTPPVVHKGSDPILELQKYMICEASAGRNNRERIIGIITITTINLSFLQRDEENEDAYKHRGDVRVCWGPWPNISPPTSIHQHYIKDGIFKNFG